MSDKWLIRPTGSFSRRGANIRLLEKYLCIICICICICIICIFSGNLEISHWLMDKSFCIISLSDKWLIRPTGSFSRRCKHSSTAEVFLYYLYLYYLYLYLYLYYLYYYYLYYREISSHAGVQTYVYWRRRKKHETFQNIYKRSMKVMRQNT